MKPNTSNNDEHKLEARIMKIEKHIRYIKTQHCDGCEPNEMCNTCKENFRELRIPLNKLKAELKGIKQGYAEALDDVNEIRKDIEIRWRKISQEDEHVSIPENFWDELQEIAKLKEKK